MFTPSNHLFISSPLCTDIKFVVGVLSTAVIVLSAFRYEVIDDDEDDDYASGSPDQNFQQQQQQLNVTTIDKKALDALSKFDRNVSGTTTYRFFLFPKHP